MWKGLFVCALSCALSLAFASRALAGQSDVDAMTAAASAYLKSLHVNATLRRPRVSGSYGAVMGCDPSGESGCGTMLFHREGGTWRHMSCQPGLGGGAPPRASDIETICPSIPPSVAAALAQ